MPSAADLSSSLSASVFAVWSCLSAFTQGVGVVAPSVISPQCAYTPSEYQTDRTPPARKVSSGAPRSSVGSPRVQVKVPWTHEEDLKVLDGVSRYGQSWAKIARDLPESRTDDAVRNRWHRLMSKQRRHEILVAVSNGGEGVDEELCDSDSNRPPKKRRGAKVSMSAPKPRSRTENNCEAAGGAYLGAGSKNGDMWTPEEDNIIDMAVRMQGLTWKAIAKLLPGRTESGCRNRWVRNQERVFAAAGMNVVGAAAVFAALNATRVAASDQALPPVWSAHAEPDGFVAAEYCAVASVTVPLQQHHQLQEPNHPHNRHDDEHHHDELHRHDELHHKLTGAVRRDRALS